MTIADPTFPPLLHGHRCMGASGPIAEAVAGAQGERFGAGDLIWHVDDHRLQLAIVLEPEIGRSRCPEILFVLMVAYADAFGVLSPPEVKMSFDWPQTILVNDGEIGQASITLSRTELQGVPDWLVAGVEIQLAPLRDDPEPGHDHKKTTLWEEGCSGISPKDLIEATARHFLAWVHTWEEDGFKPVHQAWEQRLAVRSEVSGVRGGQTLTGRPQGLDQNGGLLLKCGETTHALEIPVHPGPGQ